MRRSPASLLTADTGGVHSARWWPCASADVVPPLRAVAPELKADAMLTLYMETIGGGAEAASSFAAATNLPAPYTPCYSNNHERDENSRVTSTTATLHKLELASTHFVQVSIN